MRADRRDIDEAPVPGCHATPSPPTQSAFSFMRWPTILATSCGRWRYPRRQLREKLIKIGAKVASRGRYLTFQMTEVAVPRQMFADILLLIARLRHRRLQHEGAQGSKGADRDGRGASRGRQSNQFRCRWTATRRCGPPALHRCGRNSLPSTAKSQTMAPRVAGNPGNVGCLTPP